MAEFEATESGCFNMPVAADLVFSCIGGPIDPETKLGDIDPSTSGRRNMRDCICKTAKAGGGLIDCRLIPYGRNKKVLDMILSISCG